MKKKTETNNIDYVFLKEKNTKKKGKKYTAPLKSPKETKFCKYCVCYNKKICSFNNLFVKRKDSCDEWVLSKKFK